MGGGYGRPFVVVDVFDREDDGEHEDVVLAGGYLYAEALLLGDGRDLVPARTGQCVAIAEEMAAGGEFACRAVNVAMLPYAEASADGRGDCSVPDNVYLVPEGVPVEGSKLVAGRVAQTTVARYREPQVPGVVNDCAVAFPQ